MLRNYFKIALRTLLRNKIFSMVTILGFAFGIAACIFILLLILDAVSYDRFHEHSDRIYRVTVEVEFWGETNVNAITSPPVGPFLSRDFVEIEDFVRIRQTYPSEQLVVFGENRFHEDRVLYADGSVFSIFTFPLVKGDPSTALSEPYTVIITEEMARKYFGEDDPLYQVMDIGRNTYTITGVAQNIPSNSHIQFDFLLSYSTLPYHPDDWLSLHLYTFVLLREGYSVNTVEERMESFVKRNIHIPESVNASINNFILQPLTSIYLYSNLRYELSEAGVIRYIYLYIAIAFCILLVACINYMNLSTARYTKRTKEIGIRKVLGAQRTHLIHQFLGETFLITLFAFIIALILVELFLPEFENLVGKSISVQYYEIIYVVPVLILLMVLTAILAGMYPAVFLSSFRAIDILRKKLELISGKTLQLSVRKCLVTLQFVLSIGLISGTILIYHQLTYMRTTYLGFDKEHVVIVPVRDRVMIQRRELFKHKLAEHINIQNVSIASGVPGRITAGHPVHPEGIDYDNFMRILSVDFDYIDLFNLEIIAGRPFLKELATDADEAFILNEAAAREFGWFPYEDALEKRFAVSGMGGVTKTGQVVGIVSDFHFASLHHKVEPLVIIIFPVSYSYFAVKIAGKDIPESIRFIESKWEEFVPHRPFEYFFLDEDFDRLYNSEMQIASIMGSFSFFVILISFLGLLGLSTFTVEQRTKEIGIRKVLGASVETIVRLLSMEYFKLLIFSGVIAVPLTYYIMHRWLENFAYRVDITPVIFLAAVVASLLIAFLTVSYQSIKAALGNPVEALRYE